MVAKGIRRCFFTVNRTSIGVLEYNPEAVRPQDPAPEPKPLIALVPSPHLSLNEVGTVILSAPRSELSRRHF